MAKNYVQEGERIAYTIPAETTILSGAVVVIGSLIGIALEGGVAGDIIDVALEGVWNLPKVNTTVIALGDEVFWNAGTSKVTLVATDTPLGKAFAAAGNGPVVVDVKLVGSAVIGQSANVAAIATANGSDAGTTQALANATKTTVNGILVALKAAGLMAADA